MGKKVDMIGRRFGRLLIISEDKRDRQGIIYYKCRCDCGNEKIIKGTSIRAGITKSCGCYNRDIITKNDPKYKTKLYSVYHSIKERCNNSKDKAFHNYGGRGIKISDEWNTFEKFEEWAYQSGYQEGLWIDRIDNDKDYSSNNCRWATPKEQQNNKRNCLYITIGGITKTATEWADISGINRATIYRRVKVGLKENDILKPIDKSKSHGEAIRQSLKSAY